VRSGLELKFTVKNRHKSMFNFLKNYGKHLSGIWIGVLFFSTLFITGYTERYVSDSVSADSVQFESFVEPGFPFISTSVDARKLGPGFPDDNIAARTLALQLGENAYACFDTDLLRWSVAWTGKFLPMVQMAQISYKDFFNKNNKVTTVTGDPKIATGSYPGWSVGKSVFEDNRPVKNIGKQPNWGPMPADAGRWNGVYVYGNKAILNYSVGKTIVNEMPGSAVFGDQTAFTRTFNVADNTEVLFLTVAEVRQGESSEIKGNVAYIFSAGKDTVTAVGLTGKNNPGWKTSVSGNRYLTVEITGGNKSREGSVAIWRGPVKHKSAFEKFCKKTSIVLPDFRKGGVSQWKDAVVTQGKLSPDTAAYVTDLLTLPLHNPWKRNVRVADIAFFKDGRAAAVTFEGDVWLIEGINQDLKNIKWRRFASGLHETMSVEVVRDTVYVFGREGIVRLHDLNGDGAADYYENFSNLMVQSAESREWAADMVYAPDGSFYVAKGGSLSNGPGMTPQAAKGFRAGSVDNGTIIKISADGLKSEVIATGLRGPFLGMNPENGILTASDQQGNFVPSTPIYLIRKGDYYGVQPTAHGSEKMKITPPLTWIPHNVDRSSIGQAWITGKKMGPLNGNLIHFSFGHPGLFRVLIDSSAKIIQGGVSFIHADYPAPTSKGSLNPVDGQLYVAGFNLWGSSSTGLSALLRLRYTGKPSYMPNQFKALKQGVIIGFDSEINPDAVTDLKNFEVKRWNYQRTEEYGSGHFKTDGTSGEEILTVAGTYLSADRRKILLLIPEMAEVMQMEVNYKLRAKDGKIVRDGFWFTVNNMSELDQKKEGFDQVNLALLTAKKESVAALPEKELPASAERGKQLFQNMACSGCHSEGLNTKGMYGPPFQNLFMSERHFEDGSSITADEKYIRESILAPSKRVVKGYNAEMPSFTGVLSDSDIESIILHIKSLKK